MTIAGADELDPNESESTESTANDDEQEASDLQESGDLSVSDSTTKPRTVAWVLIAAGAVMAIVFALRSPRKGIIWLLPLLMLGAGLAILSQQRRAQLNVVAGRILTEMDGIDPIGRIQVLVAVLRQELRNG